MTNHILKNDGKLLQGLFQKLGQLQEFNQIFAQYVEPAIITHCKIANLQNNCLIVIVDSGNWATQLRFHIPDLIIKLRNHPPFQQLKAICCKTRPDVDPIKYQKKRKSRKMKSLSPQTAALILKAAENIQDARLRKIFERIVGKRSS